MTMISVNVEVTLNLPESGLSVKKTAKQMFILVALLKLILEFVLIALNAEFKNVCEDV